MGLFAKQIVFKTIEWNFGHSVPRNFNSNQSNDIALS